jgi:hypothetical protein
MTMNIRTFLCSLMFAFPVLANAADTRQAFSGQDYSGVYTCTGNDAHEGKYTGTVTMTLDRNQSTGRYGAYSFKLEVPGFGAYLGEAVGEGNRLAIYFALPDLSTKDYGIGIASIRKEKDGKFSFNKFYYEPEYKGGNTGTETCVQK